MKSSAHVVSRGVDQLRQVEALLQQQQKEKAMMIANSIRGEAIRAYALVLCTRSKPIQ